MIYCNVYPKEPIKTNSKKVSSKGAPPNQSFPSVVKDWDSVESAGSDHHQTSSSKSTKASPFKCKTLVVSNHWMTGYKRPVENVLALLHVNHQLREEVLPIFFANRTIEIHERSIELTKTHNWLKGTPTEHLQHLRSIHIRVKDTERRNYASPLPWLQAEENALPKEAKVVIRCHYNTTEGIWKNAYQLGRTCRDSGMKWSVVEKCIKHLKEVIDATYWLEQEDYDTGGEDMSDSDFERMEYGAW